jgi:hypothetical protein
MDIPDELIKTHPVQVFAIMAKAGYFNLEAAKEELRLFLQSLDDEDVMFSFEDVTFKSKKPATFAAYCTAEEWNGGVGATKEIANEMFVQSAPEEEDASDWEESKIEKVDRIEEVNNLRPKFDPKGLEDEITKRLGFKPAGLKIELKPFDYRHTSGIGVFVSSDNLVDKAGIMNQVFEKVALTTPNYGTGVEEGKPISWMQVNFAWRHIGGGTNGGDWFTAWYNFDDKKWTFQDR